MDLQGTPLPHGHRSTKVTNDPASQQPIEEPSGPVASDSLAAESVRHGGAFSENRGAEPMGVSGNKSTLNTTNTSAATELPPASEGALREDRQRQEKYPEALGGQGNFPGAHHSGYAGGPTAAKKEMGMNAGEYSTASGSGRSKFDGGQAPSYVNDITPGYQHTKPAGRNIHEGGFDADDKNNASFNSEIGSDQDPGRAAINKFQRTTAESGPDAGHPRQKKVDNQQPFQALDEQRA